MNPLSLIDLNIKLRQRNYDRLEIIIDSIHFNSELVKKNCQKFDEQLKSKNTESLKTTLSKNDLLINKNNKLIKEKNDIVEINRKLLNEYFKLTKMTKIDKPLIGLKEIKNQFYLDIPRMKIYIDNELYDNPKEVEDKLNSVFDPTIIKTIMYITTQTFLAEFYIEEFKTIKENAFDNEHLVDFDYVYVYINTIDKLIRLKKEFRKVWINNEFEEFEVDTCRLNIVYDIVTKMLSSIWENEVNKSSRYGKGPTEKYFLIN